jgi:membrane protease YdiL (CAAX protease family)
MKKILNHPVTRIILGLMACFIAFIIAQNLAGKLLELTGTGKDLRNLIKGIFASLAVIMTYRLLFKWIEKRSVIELSNKNILKNLGIGLLIGVSIQCNTMLVIYFYHGFKIISVNPVSFIIIPLTVAFTVAIFEEILLRGIIFRIIEERLGSYIALLISALIFGALHLANPHATVISAICVAAEAGLLLGAAYIYSRSLWLPIAIHFAWNFMQSGIFGAITSGNEKTPGLLTTQLTGPELITGGSFGPEGTIQATVFCLMVTAAFMYFNIKNGYLVKRSLWNRL